MTRINSKRIHRQLKKLIILYRTIMYHLLTWVCTGATKQISHKFIRGFFFFLLVVMRQNVDIRLRQGNFYCTKINNGKLKIIRYCNVDNFVML